MEQIMRKVRATDKYFLSIAATDTTGEAGIIKDCKVADSLGFNTLSAITAITTQNDESLLEIYPVQRAILSEQLQVCSTFKVDCIKIGALGNLENGLIVAEYLKLFPDALIVWDPVFSPTRGKPFITHNDINELTGVLLPLIDMVTPNFNELLKILDRDEHNITGWQRQTQQTAEKYNVTFYVTGGHTPARKNNIEEYLISKDLVQSFERERIPLRYHHGTGCTFSTALACLMAEENDLITALKCSSAFIDNLYT